MTDDLLGKRALVVGIANEHSLAWGVAQHLHNSGARLAITYLNEKALPFVQPLANAVSAELLIPLNVSKTEQELDLFNNIKQTWGGLDILVHSIAFAPLDDLHGRVIDVGSSGFAEAMDTSVHSFIRLARYSEPLMTSGGSCLTMSFYGARKVVPHYNVMGPVKAALEAVTRDLAAELGPRNITVNALSPGPIATRAASGIDHFDDMMSQAISISPLRRLATLEDVGAAAAFILSDKARNITGCVIHIDAGRHIIG